jgi:hypothetical protein
VPLSARWHALLTREASSRVAGLLRIGLALIALARFADDLLPMRDHRPASLAIHLAFYVSTLTMLVGYRARAATACAGLTQLALASTEGWHHHTYLLASVTLWLVLTPCDRSYSLDRWRALKRDAALPEEGPSYGLTLIALQLSAVYFWGILHKLDPLYLSGAQIEHVVRTYQLGSDDVAFASWWWSVLGVGIALMEASLMVGLWIRRWHRWIMPFGIVFHGVLYVALQVDTFTVTVWLLYLAYLDPDEVHSALEHLQRA